MDLLDPARWNKKTNAPSFYLAPSPLPPPEYRVLVIVFGISHPSTSVLNCTGSKRKCKEDLIERRQTPGRSS